jgi:hypothetical protein
MAWLSRTIIISQKQDYMNNRFTLPPEEKTDFDALGPSPVT